jgi:hypothetical protein
MPCFFGNGFPRVSSVVSGCPQSKVVLSDVQSEEVTKALKCAANVAAAVFGGEGNNAVVEKKGVAARRLRPDNNPEALRKSVRFCIPMGRESPAPVIEAATVARGLQ